MSVPEQIPGYGQPCIICGDEGHHVLGHDPKPEPDVSSDPPGGDAVKSSD